MGPAKTAEHTTTAHYLLYLARPHSYSLDPLGPNGRECQVCPASSREENLNHNGHNNTRQCPRSRRRQDYKIISGETFVLDGRIEYKSAHKKSGKTNGRPGKPLFADVSNVIYGLQEESPPQTTTTTTRHAPVELVEAPEDANGFNGRALIMQYILSPLAGLLLLSLARLVSVGLSQLQF